MAMREPQYDEAGNWVPRSGYFRHYYLKARAREMVQQDPQGAGARLAFCTYCQSAYLASDAVPNSPCHDAPPALMYDLERLIDAATFVETFSEALQATDPEDLLHRIEVLAGLARTGEGGGTGELSQEPSTAAGAEPPASAQDGSAFIPVASVEGANEPEVSLASPPAPQPDAEGVTSPAAPSAPQARTRRSRAAAPAVPA